MKRLTASASFTFLWLVLSCLGQEQPPRPADDLQHQLNQFLKQHRSEESNILTLPECSTRLREWEAWADTNLPNYERMRQDNNELTAENSRLNRKLESQSWIVMQWLFWVSVGLAAGALAMYAIVKTVKWSWPQSAPRKQLFVLLAAATWITLVALLAILIGRSGPINLLANVVLYSLPAILFAGIGFWWVGRSEPKSKMGF